MDLFTAYRKMFASLDTRQTVVWWYCGVVNAQREGLGEVPIAQAETIMAYRTRDLGADAFAIDWREVGYFRDIATGAVMEGWFNPLRFATDAHPRTFVDGPATFTARREGAEGVHIDLVQHNARIDAVTLQPSVNPHSIGLVQTETKTRTFHRPDGSLPPLDSDEATAIETVLSIWSDPAAVADAAQPNVASRGFYRSGSRGLGGKGSWAQTRVSGVLVKSRDDERLNPLAWDRLQAAFPDFFRDGRVAPDWD